MTAFNRATRRRLQQLPQIPSVWEGDRRPLAPNSTLSMESDAESGGECILWVDGSEGIVRAMDVVSPEAGPNAIVRTLLRAMEHPHSPAKSARPQKIVVRDREIQFFLRGVLQELGITIDYVPNLPLIDEIFRGFQEVASTRPPQVPPYYADAMMEIAYNIWRDAPWAFLDEHQILAVELNEWDIGTLYVSIMGKLGMEYGILLYRSLDSLKRFRSAVLADETPERMEEAFLRQDCLFITFEAENDADDDDDDDDDIDLTDLPFSEIEPSFGNLHPLEGLRSFLYEEEAIAVLVALDALHRFFRANYKKLFGENFPILSSRYRITVPVDEDGKQETFPVKVSTMPEIAQELWDMAPDDDDDDMAEETPLLRNDLVPKDSFFSLGAMPWHHLEILRAGVEVHQKVEHDIPDRADGFPVILIQTSLPKAKVMIEELQKAGGIKAICFNPGEDPVDGDRYDLGILQTGNGQMYLFGEFMEDNPIHIAARQKWDQRCKQTQGYCGLIIARGLKGASRGKPQIKDMIALFETKSMSSKDLGLGTLQLISAPF